MNIEAKIHLNKFIPREYQKPFFDAMENKGFKRALLVWHRRAGKDVACFNFMIRQALKRVGSYYYILPTFKQARLTVFEGMTNEGKRFLDFVPEQLIAQINKQELKVSLVNGSTIYFVGSNDYDSLRGTNPLGVIFSEYAYQHPNVYATLRPILVANDGWSVFISCVAPSTLIIGEKGLKRIKDVTLIEGEYTPFSGEIFGLGGFHKATHFYHGKNKPTLIITLSNGYSLECTPVHPVWNGREWIKSKDLAIGDVIPIQYGQNVWPEDLTFDDFFYKPHGAIKDLLFERGSSDFFYILGLIHADGNYDKNKICITNKKDEYIRDFLTSLGFKTRKDGIHHELSSKPLCSLLEYLGFKHGAKNKVFPEKLLSCSKAQMISFLQGVFDGDGCSNSDPAHGGSISIASSCKEFIDVLKVVLLNIGIVSSFRRTLVKPTKLVRVPSTIYHLEIVGYFAHVFYETIGFRIKRKQKNKVYISERCKEDHENRYPIDISRLQDYKLPKNIVTNPQLMSRRVIKKLNDRNYHPYLDSLLREQLFYSQIVSIEESESDVYDFVIPETHSFFSNGFISHNTPFGENHFYSLYEVARNSPEQWFSDVLTVDDTGIISPHEIEREIAESIMSPDMVEQEYKCSFSVGAIGAYYAKYLNRMEIDGKVDEVPWEGAFPVHTAWDLGMRDQTVILFFQVIGQTIRIIDCYENSDVGLEHYINIIQAKPYTYGKHIAPHDIKVRDYTGGGRSRWDKASDLGIKFMLAPEMSIIDGIEVVRSTLNKVWVDRRQCTKLVRALRDYRKEYDTQKKVYKPFPYHDYNSNWADAMRYLCISLPKIRTGLSPEELDKRYEKALYGDRLPRFFEETPY